MLESSMTTKTSCRLGKKVRSLFFLSPSYSRNSTDSIASKMWFSRSLLPICLRDLALVATVVYKYNCTTRIKPDCRKMGMCNSAVWMLYECGGITIALSFSSSVWASGCLMVPEILWKKLLSLAHLCYLSLIIFIANLIDWWWYHGPSALTWCLQSFLLVWMCNKAI